MLQPDNVLKIRTKAALIDYAVCLVTSVIIMALWTIIMIDVHALFVELLEPFGLMFIIGIPIVTLILLVMFITHSFMIAAILHILYFMVYSLITNGSTYGRHYYNIKLIRLNSKRIGLITLIKREILGNILIAIILGYFITTFISSKILLMIPHSFYFYYHIHIILPSLLFGGLTAGIVYTYTKILKSNKRSIPDIISSTNIIFNT